ncbi:MAG: class I SAM-dependent methyltransferase, partial [Lachnospiraceae bacterium]|nr:class I SAM-dependent methyltransferase [Lachnospiraceae bacterium]
VAATAQFLRQKGLLTENQEIIDVGCGPGSFVTEFAKTSKHVVGTDISPKMLEYGAMFAEQAGRKNVSYVAGDFKQLDLEQLGWKKRFDLVFSSITPAISGMDGIERMMEICRGYCYNTVVIYREDDLLQEIREEVFGIREKNQAKFNSQWFYALFNMMYLRGYYSETSYYHETYHGTWASAEEAARDYAPLLRRITGDEQAEEKIVEYIRKKYSDGRSLSYEEKTIYGCLLWDLRENHL